MVVLVVALEVVVEAVVVVEVVVVEIVVVVVVQFPQEISHISNLMLLLDILAKLRNGLLACHVCLTRFFTGRIFIKLEYFSKNIQVSLIFGK